MFRDGHKPEEFRIRIDLNYGGLGDLLARLPAIRYAYTQWPHLLMHVFVYDYAFKLIENLLKPYNDRVYVCPFSAQPSWLERPWCKRMPHIDFTPMLITGVRMHLTEQGFVTICDKIPREKSEWNYLEADLTKTDISMYDLPERYGILCTEYTAPVREWPAQEVEEVARWMIRNKITPVFLGKKENPLGLQKGSVKTRSEFISKDDCVDLRDKTDLLQALKIIKNSVFIAGVDNGLLHLASCTSTPTIWGFTTVEPVQRLPYRMSSQTYRAQTVTPTNLSCGFCQSNHHYFKIEGKAWDYKHCMYGDKICTTHMTAGKFIDKIKQVINFKGLGATNRAR